GAHPLARLRPVGTLTRPQTGAVSRQARLSCAPGLVHNRSSQDSARRQCQERPLDPWGNAERPMSNTTFFPVPDEVAESAWIDAAKYERMYAESISNPKRFWAEHGRRIDWIKPFTKVKDVSFTGKVHIRWFYDGVLNVSANGLDRHLNQRADQTAILWEGDDPKEHRHVSYGELHQSACRLANVLKAQGIRKGDRVTIYMPMIPEIAVAMFACARIGAIHSVVFGGFSPESLIGRIQDCATRVVISADGRMRRAEETSLNANVDEAVDGLSTTKVDAVVVVRRTSGAIAWKA